MPFFRTWYGKLILGAVIVLLLLWGNMWADHFLKLEAARKIQGFAYPFRIVMLSGIAIILAVSLNLVNGVTGQFSIGHVGFMALGGYAAAALTVYGQYKIFPPLREAAPVVQHSALLASMVLGGLVSALAGFVVGLPSLRLRGDYLAIVTLGFGEIIRVAILNIEAVGGAAGFSGYASPQGRVTIPPLTNFFWVYLTVVGLVLFSRNLLRSTEGLAFFSIREDEIAAEAMGVPTTRIKVTAFVIGAFFAGVAGALYAHYEIYLQPESFNFMRSIEIVTMVVLGGMGSITGSVLGAILLTAVPEVLRVSLGDLARQGRLPGHLSPDLVRQLLFALLLVVMMLVRPQGILGAREVSLRGLFQRRRRTIGTPLTTP